MLEEAERRKEWSWFTFQVYHNVIEKL